MAPRSETDIIKLSTNLNYGFHFNADKTIANIGGTAKRNKTKAKQALLAMEKLSEGGGEGGIHFAGEWESQTKANFQNWKKCCIKT